MRLHRNTSEAVVETLRQVFAERRYADKVIEKVLKQNPKWGARDRRFIAETAYDIVRWFRYLRYVASASGDDYWKLLAAWCVLHGIDLPAWDEFKGVDAGKVRRTAKEGVSRKIAQSVPDWMDALGERELGDRWDNEVRALNEEARVVLRTNTLRIDRPDLKMRLEEEDVVTHVLDEFPDALVLDERQNVFTTPSFREGFFEVQDAASQHIAPFLRPDPGMRVIDACAGAGGKSLHLAALMKNKGRIVAMDTEAWKLGELQKRARRAGVSNLETRVIESSKTIKRLEGSADRVLLDVPCSGLGVLKRNPDAKWKLSPGFLDDVRDLQQHILNDYCLMVKAGGFVVYSTCSILPSENEEQVQQFLERRAGQFALLEEKRCWPSEGFDGFYMALLTRVK